MKNLIDTLHTVHPLDGWLSSHEAALLYTLATNVKKEVIVEIGSWKGKSTICLARGTLVGSKVKVYAIDPHLGEYSWGDTVGKKVPTYSVFLKNIKHAKIEKLVKPIVATSEKASKKWHKKISLLFIDGLHDYYHTKQDFSLWQRYVVQNGYVVFHDAFCGYVGPGKVAMELLKKSQYSNFAVVGSIVIAQKKKAVSFIGKLDVYRHQLLIPFALWINEQNISHTIKFFLIHRIIKTLLINRYTLNMVIQHI